MLTCVLQTRELVTGSAASERGYFRLHLNQYMAVETVTCLSKEVRHCCTVHCSRTRTPGLDCNETWN